MVRNGFKVFAIVRDYQDLVTLEIEFTFIRLPAVHHRGKKLAAYLSVFVLDSTGARPQKTYIAIHLLE